MNRVGRPPIGDDDPRLARLLELSRANPKRGVASMARELGIGTERAWEALAKAGLVNGRRRDDDDSMIAPAWYEKPCGRIQALRAAHGIVVR